MLEYGPVVAEETVRAGRSSKQVGASIMIVGFIGRSRYVAVEAAKPYLLFQAHEYLENVRDDPAEKATAVKMRVAYERGDGPFTASEWIETIDRRVESIVSAGLRPDWVNITLWHAGMPLAQAVDALECFAAEVLPHSALEPWRASMKSDQTPL